MTEAGLIRRVNGPLVEIDGLGDVAMYDLVRLGPAGIAGEIVAIRDDRVTAQAYEYSGGLAPGHPASATGRPLSARVGPGLLGHIFDGLLRPLSAAPAFLEVGGQRRSGDGRWRFVPSLAEGVSVRPGEVLGAIPGAGSVQYRVLVPPGVAGQVEWLAPEGEYGDDARLATVAGTAIGVWSDWPVRRPRPHRGRSDTVEPLHTGTRVVDLLFPIARGGSAAVPGGFGTGKTVLLQQLAKWCHADVIVYVGCGERGNEMAEVLADLMTLEDPRTGGRLADRTVVIANTSNMPMMAREASIYTGVTVAEHFRDMGYDAVVIADSTSRWAEALREFASRSGALPAEEGYPADLASALAAFYERSGAVQTLGGATGSVTVIGAVSPPGGDLTEPVTAYTERFVRGRWTLDADLAYARHYPAVSWSGSFARDAEALTTDPVAAARRGRTINVLAEADRLAALAELVGVGALPGYERMVVLGGRLLREAVLQQSALSTTDAFCSAAKAAALADATLAVLDACQDAVRAGAPAGAIEEVDFGPLVRAREATDPEDADGVAKYRDAVLSRISAVRP